MESLTRLTKYNPEYEERKINLRKNNFTIPPECAYYKLDFTMIDELPNYKEVEANEDTSNKFSDYVQDSNLKTSSYLSVVNSPYTALTNPQTSTYLSFYIYLYSFPLRSGSVWVGSKTDFMFASKPNEYRSIVLCDSTKFCFGRHLQRYYYAFHNVLCADGFLDKSNHSGDTYENCKIEVKRNYFNQFDLLMGSFDSYMNRFINGCQDIAVFLNLRTEMLKQWFNDDLRFTDFPLIKGPNQILQREVFQRILLREKEQIQFLNRKQDFLGKFENPDNNCFEVELRNMQQEYGFESQNIYKSNYILKETEFILDACKRRVLNNELLSMYGTNVYNFEKSKDKSSIYEDTDDIPYFGQHWWKKNFEKIDISRGKMERYTPLNSLLPFKANENQPYYSFTDVEKNGKGFVSYDTDACSEMFLHLQNARGWLLEPHMVVLPLSNADKPFTPAEPYPFSHLLVDSGMRSTLVKIFDDELLYLHVCIEELKMFSIQLNINGIIGLAVEKVLNRLKHLKYINFHILSEYQKFINLWESFGYGTIEDKSIKAPGLRKKLHKIIVELEEFVNNNLNADRKKTIYVLRSLSTVLEKFSLGVLYEEIISIEYIKNFFEEDLKTTLKVY